jgi:hypothetical protein
MKIIHKLAFLRELFWFCLIGLLVGGVFDNVITQGRTLHFWVICTFTFIWTLMLYLIARKTNRELKEVKKTRSEITEKLNFYESLGVVKRVNDEDEDGR